MLFLGIDTSTTTGTVALASPEKVHAEWTLEVPRTHADRLLPHIRYILSEADLTFQDLKGIAVTTGPGSFTGLRIGITTAKTLAHVSGKPLVGVPTLDVLAANVPHATGLICSVLDARRGEIYAAVYRRDGSGKTERLTEYLAVTPEALLEMIPEPALFVGNGVWAYSDRFRETDGHRVVLEPELNHVRAPVLCRLAREQYRLQGGTKPGDLKALYVRPSDAEKKRVPPPAP
jgi:tRNA threonylcarbamoyladenosine biosynthesis protein TsaB